jgi:hypothetical protein
MFQFRPALSKKTDAQRGGNNPPIFYLRVLHANDLHLISLQINIFFFQIYTKEKISKNLLTSQLTAYRTPHTTT